MTRLAPVVRERGGTVLSLCSDFHLEQMVCQRDVVPHVNQKERNQR